jgi:hypothetical protein
MSGGLRRIAWRSRCGMSRCAADGDRPIPFSGARRLARCRRRRLERRYVHDPHTLAQPFRLASQPVDPHRKAASVFPDPVGAQISVLALSTIFGQPIA